MLTSVTLPTWLDKLIFQKMGAKFCRSNADMTVIDWDKADMLKYLGTYFPRSYAESYLQVQDRSAIGVEEYIEKIYTIKHRGDWGREAPKISCT